MVGQGVLRECLLDNGLESVLSGNLEGVVISGKGHWLLEEAPQQVMPRLVAFINKSQ